MSALIMSDYVNIVDFWLGIELLFDGTMTFRLPAVASLQNSRIGWNGEIEVGVLEITAFFVRTQ